ncbi:MAG: O-antigen ligase family protein [Dehalococcoidia bacterium]|nr:O-antigen ligase family protein [Dehalococcoidia bacterium]
MYLLAHAVTVLAAGITIGTIVRETIPPVLVAAAFLLVWAADIRGVTQGLTPKRLGIGEIVSILALAVLVGFFIVSLASSYSVTYLLVIGLAIVGVVTSVILALTSDGPRPVVVFLLAYPLIAYLESEFNFREALAQVLTVGPFTYTPSLAFIWILTLAVLLRKLATRQALTRTRLDLFILAWLFVLFLSSLNSRLPLESLQELLNDATMPLLFFVIVNRTHTRHDVVTLCLALLIASFVRLAILLYFYLLLLQRDVSFGVGASIFKLGVHMGVLGWIASTILPLSLVFVAYSPRFRAKLALLGLAAFSVVVILVIRIRSAVIASFLPAVLLMIQVRAKAAWYFAGAMVLTAVLVLAVGTEPLWLDRFQSWTSLQAIETEQAQRLDLWQAAVRMTLDHPLLGVGLRMFEEVSPQYLHTDWSAEGRGSSYAHEVLLHYASAGGLGALAAVLGLHIVALRTAWIIGRKNADPQLRALALGLSWAVTSMLLSGLIGGTGFASGNAPDRPMGQTDQGIFFWVVVGLVFVMAALTSERVSASEHQV